MKGGILLTFALFVCYITLSAAQQEDEFTLISDTSSQIIGTFTVGEETIVFTDYANNVYKVFNVTEEVSNSSVTTIPIGFPDGLVQTAIYDPVNQTIYLGGAETFYKVLLTGNYKVSTIPAPTIEDQLFASAASFIDISRRNAYFITNAGYIAYFDINNATGISPIVANGRNQYFLTNSTNIAAAAYNESDQMVYMTSTQLEKFSVGSRTSVAVVPFVPGAISQYLEIEPNSQNIWVCVDGNTSENKTAILIYDPDLNQVGSIQFDEGDNCQGMKFDSVRGSAVISLRLKGNDEVYVQFTTTLPPQQVGGQNLIQIDHITDLIVNPDNRTLVVFGLTGIEFIQYDSICPDDCNGNGQCLNGACICDSAHRGLACDFLSCALNCSYPQGICLSDGQCNCNPDWQGDVNCSTKSCPNKCNGHGICSGFPSYTCTCVDSWSGPDCGVPPPPPPPSPCSTFHTYQQCVSYDYCGWCGDYRVGSCGYGNLTGPYYHACEAWWFDQEPEIGVPILAIVFLCLIGVMFLIDMFSAIRVDFSRAKDLREEYQSGKARKPTVSEAAALWWRDQRSAKAYTYLEQFQFLAFFQHLALTYPSRILQFTRFVDWSNLGIPIPFMKDETLHPERRKLLGMVQYANGLEILPKDIYANNMFWFGIGVGGICVFYGLLILILYRKIHWRVVLTCRLTYILVRFMNVAYLGLCVTTTYTLVAPPHDYRTIVPAAFTLIILGIGWPIGVYFLVNGRTKQLLLDNEFRYKFGALYVSYKPEKKLFFVHNLLRKFFTGIFIGFLSFDPLQNPKYIVLIQAGLLVLVQILYAIDLFRSKPYYDHFHEYLEYFLVIVNIATIALSMLHYNKPLQAGELIIGLVQVLGFVACAGTYIVSWMQMSPFNFSKLLCCCKPKDDPNIPLEGVTLSEN